MDGLVISVEATHVDGQSEERQGDPFPYYHEHGLLPDLSRVWHGAYADLRSPNISGAEFLRRRWEDVLILLHNHTPIPEVSFGVRTALRRLGEGPIVWGMDAVLDQPNEVASNQRRGY